MAEIQESISKFSLNHIYAFYDIKLRKFLTFILYWLLMNPKKKITKYIISTVHRNSYKHDSKCVGIAETYSFL